MSDADAALAAQGWQPIETAPKDGVRVMLWRGPASCGQWSEMVIAEWYEGAWRWPDQRENPSTHGEWTEDDLLEGYADSKSFTHWMPLPEPPNQLHDRTALDRLIAKAEADALRNAEARLLGLLNGEHSSLTIGFNDDHSCNYVNAKGWRDDFGFYTGDENDRISWASDTEREKAISTNSVWTLQWYPETPVGFNCIGAPSLAALFDMIPKEGA